MIPEPHHALSSKKQVNGTKLMFWSSLFSLGLLIGFGIGVFWTKNYGNTAKDRGSIARQKGYAFINPILSCEVAGSEDAFQELKPIKNAVSDAIRNETSKKTATAVSVYFRLLNSGRWFELNGEEKFIPASLLKVTIMVGYFKLAESEPAILQEKITYKNGKADETLSNAADPENLEDGKTYTAEELIRRMIVYSSNPALNLLLSRLDDTKLQVLKDVYGDLSIALPEKVNEAELDFLTAKSYALIFRVLYGATYLNGEMSEKALILLSKTEFKDGLTAKIPQNLFVAHKFGAQSTQSKNLNLEGIKLRELHDCGIVYYPDHPYLLCVMTRGYGYDDLKTVIAEISKITYTEIGGFFSKNN